MSDRNLGKDVKIVDLTPIAAGTGAANGDTVDMAGFESVMFILHFSASNAGNGLSSVQQDDDSAMGSPGTGEGTAQLLDGTKLVLVSDVIAPRERYVRPVVARAASAAVSGVAVLYGPESRPTTHGAGVSYEMHESPAVGTP